MSNNGDELKPFKDAFISSLFTLTKASNDSADALINLLNKMDEMGALSAEDFANLPLTKEQLSRIGSSGTEDEKPALARDSSESPAEPKAEPEKKKRKQRAPHDPNMPKRPLQPYLSYSNEQKRKIREERASQELPPLSMSEINELVSKGWQELSAGDRETLDNTYRASLKDYNESLSAYKANLDVIKPAPADEEISSTQEDKPAEHDEESSPAPQSPVKKSSRKKSSSAPSGSVPTEPEAGAHSADEKSEPAKRKRSKKAENKDVPERKKRAPKATKESSKAKEHDSE